MKDRPAGFTIVEILIVLTILAILAMVVVPQWSKASTDARQSRLDCDLQTVRKQITLYQAQHAGRTPDLDENAHADTGNFVARLIGKTDSRGKVNGGTLGPYLTEWPTNVFVPASVAGEVKFGTASHAPGDGSTGWYFCTATGVFSANHVHSDKINGTAEAEPVQIVP